MAIGFITGSGAPLGVQTDQFRRRVINRTGGTLTAGKLVMLDLGQVDGDISNATIGDENSIFANVVTPTTAGLRHGIFAVVLEGGADDAEVTVVLWGVVEAEVEGTNATAVTDVLIPKNAQGELNSDVGAAGEKIIGIPLATTASGTAASIKVWFNGVTGFGSSAG